MSLSQTWLHVQDIKTSSLHDPNTSKVQHTMIYIHSSTPERIKRSIITTITCSLRLQKMKHTDQKLVHNQESTVLFYWHNFRVATFNFFWPNGLSPAKLKTLSEPRVFTSLVLFIFFFLPYFLLKGIVYHIYIYVLKQQSLDNSKCSGQRSREGQTGYVRKLLCIGALRTHKPDWTGEPPRCFASKDGHRNLVSWFENEFQND